MNWLNIDAGFLGSNKILSLSLYEFNVAVYSQNEDQYSDAGFIIESIYFSSSIEAKGRSNLVGGK